MSGTLALAPREQAPTETRNHGVDFTGKLKELSGDPLLTGTPTVTVSPSGPTLSNKQVSTIATVINDNEVDIAKAVLFTCTGGTDGVDYTITVTCGTTSSPAETLVGTLTLKVRV